MDSAADQLLSFRRDVEAMGSLPLLPLGDFVEYSGVCQRALAMASEIASADSSADDVEDVSRELYELGIALRRAGDGLAAAEVLECAGRYASAGHDARRASSSYNSAGITLYQLGVYDRAYTMLDRAIAVLDDDDFGRVRSLGIRMNHANVLHYQRRFEEADREYAELYGLVDRIAPDLVRLHSSFAHDELLGFLSVNLAGNKCLWAQISEEQSLDSAELVDSAERHLDDAWRRPLKEPHRMTAECLRAHIEILRGRPDVAVPMLTHTAAHCAENRDLLTLLPQVYRYSAEAQLALGNTEQSLLECHRALESSLAVANDLEERGVVDTFVDLLRLSSRCVLDPAAPRPQRAHRFASETTNLVAALVDFLERKDWYTGNSHSRAVTTLSMRIAAVLTAREGVDGERARREIEDATLSLAATLHDIGKLGLPWSLLNKIVPLRAWELDVLHGHSAIGEEILTRVGLPEIGAIAAEHHETPLGTGYPRGTREISLMGAILAVADAFEAMTTVNRRYRTPKTLEEAVREVAAQRGVQFEPAAADALVALFENKI